MLTAEWLMDRALLEDTGMESGFRPLANLNVIKLGGQSIIDRGRDTALPLVDEIVAARRVSRASHQASSLASWGWVTSAR
jgi:molybdenum storage protein